MFQSSGKCWINGSDEDLVQPPTNAVLRPVRLSIFVSLILTAAAPWLTHMWGQAVAETDMDAKPPASDPAEAAAKKEN